MSTRIRICAAAATAASLLALPGHATGGGVAVITPPDGSPKLCKVGSAAPSLGGMEPAPRVVGCAGGLQFSIGFVKVGGDRWLCHYAAAPGFSDNQGVCGSVDVLGEHARGSDILRASTVRHEASGPLYVTGLVRARVGQVQVNLGSSDEDETALRASLLPVPPAIAQTAKPLLFFAVPLPAGTSLCDSIVITASVLFPKQAHDEVSLPLTPVRAGDTARRENLGCAASDRQAADDETELAGRLAEALPWLARILSTLNPDPEREG